MTSDRKIKANRANARASTGPKTAPGRARAVRNAFRHGLSLPVYSDPALSEEVGALAREIAGVDADAEIHDLARRVAEAEIDLQRVRSARHQLLSRALSNRFYESRANVREKVVVLRRQRQRNLPAIPIAAPGKFLPPRPEGPQKFALILSQESKQLLALDRYERRARLRRKFAIRGFDEARQR